MPEHHAEQAAVLHFDRPVLLLGGARVPLPQLRRELARGLPLVAADGGANQLLGSDIIPDAIVGDMDSLEHRQNWQQRCQLIAIEEQDSTDFEKCLYSVSAPSYLALGFCGDRLDHTLASLHVLARHLQSHAILLIGEHDLIVVCDGDLQLSLNVGSRLSIFPLSPVRFRGSKGLKYPLDHLHLAVGEAIGTSNTVIDRQLSIHKAEGDPGLYAVIAPLEEQAAFEAWIERANSAPL